MLKHKTAAAVLCVVLVALFAGAAQAHEYDRNDSDCPMRYAAYLLHPVGVALEWTITRPFHWLVMKPGFSYVFGHEPVPGKGVVTPEKAREAQAEPKKSAADRSVKPEASTRETHRAGADKKTPVETPKPVRS